MIDKLFNHNRYERMTTWQVLTEVDKAMAGKPGWVSYNWLRYSYKGTGKMTLKNRKQRAQQRKGQ